MPRISRGEGIEERDCRQFGKGVALQRDPNDPRMCKAKFKNSPNRKCGNWALRGSKFCKFHGGHMAMSSKGGAIKQHLTKMPVVYKKFLNKTLHDALEDQLGVKPSDQLQLLEELALLRDFAGQTVALYAAARKSNNSKAVMATGSMMTEMLTKVSRMAEQAAKVTAHTSDNYSVHDLQYIVFQLVHFMHQVCGTQNQHLAIEFERKVKENLVLPKAPEGVSYQPHEDVIEMDNTVPSVE